MNVCLNVVLWLKYEKIDIDRRDCRGNTLLHYAAQSSATSNIKFLLKKGANPNVLNDNGDSPLSLGLKRKFSNHKSLNHLLVAGADLLEASEYFENTFFGLRSLKRFNNEMVAYRLVSQLAIHEALGHPIDKPLKALHELNFRDMNIFHARCRLALRRLKSHEIRGERFSMFTILSERPEKIARYIKNEDWSVIKEYMKTYNWRTMVLFYVGAMKKYVEDIAEYKICREKADEVVREFTGFDDRYYLIVDRIVDCFSARDLLMFK